MTECTTQSIVGSDEMNRTTLGQALAAREQRPRELAWEPRPLRVLVIDDEQDTAEATSRLIRLWGHDVRKATSAKAGLEEAVAYRPDFLLLDIGMPMMDGCELARQLRSDARLRGCFIAVITGYGSAQQRRRCQEAGVDLFLVKPVNPTILEFLLALEGERMALQHA